MYLFLIPLITGFVFNAASAQTTSFSRRWGEKRGSLITFILRNILGIPFWAIGFILAVRRPASLLFRRSLPTDVLGVILLSTGGVIIIIALVSIRSRAALPSTRDALVHKGLYARVRHPIHSGTFLEFLGLFVFKPTTTVAVACGLGIVWVLVQTKLEERDLLQRIPAYGDYMKRVPRFFPGRRQK